MNEEWRPIPGYEGYYEVSDLGRVRSIDRRIWNSRGRGFWVRLTGKELTPVRSSSGHYSVMLVREGQGTRRFVHRLVLEAFVGRCPDGFEACHGDGNPGNNALPNLRWDTRSANQLDMVRHGKHWCAQKEVCAHGHPFSPENTRHYRGERICKECSREACRRYRKRRTGAAA